MGGFGPGRRRGRLHLPRTTRRPTLDPRCQRCLVIQNSQRPCGMCQANSTSEPPSALDHKLRVTDYPQFEVYRVSPAVRGANKLRSWELGRFQLQVFLRPLTPFLHGLREKSFLVVVRPLVALAGQRGFRRLSQSYWLAIRLLPTGPKALWLER